MFKAKTHHEGYHEARSRVMQDSEADLLELLDTLFGRDNLPNNFTLEQLRREALNQLDREWRTPEGREQQKDIAAFSAAIIADQRRKVNPLSRTIYDN